MKLDSRSVAVTCRGRAKRKRPRNRLVASSAPAGLLTFSVTSLPKIVSLLTRKLGTTRLPLVAGAMGGEARATRRYREPGRSRPSPKAAAAFSSLGGGLPERSYPDAASSTSFSVSVGDWRSLASQVH